MQNEQLTERIIGCAFKVHNALGQGFVEQVYENALRIEPSNAEEPLATPPVSIARSSVLKQSRTSARYLIRYPLRLM